MGQAPTHPELLDWLASWFVENGWSLRKLHALIVGSNTYRMSKASNPEYAKAVVRAASEAGAAIAAALP